MDFRYQDYINLLENLRFSGYHFCDYHTYSDYDKCVILRHDIDNSLEQALKLAELESKLGAKSTYFVLLTSDFYNPASAVSRENLHKIQRLGHEIGLHFDEVAYGPISTDECISKILYEAEILGKILGTKVTTVSMHRPSVMTLEADLEIPGMINSYGNTFFNGFKYLSDSRRRWREPVEKIVSSGEYSRLHILTHAFWYHDENQSIQQTVSNFINCANDERYNHMAENITDLHAILDDQM